MTVQRQTNNKGNNCRETSLQARMPEFCKIGSSKTWRFSVTYEPSPRGLYECLGLHKKRYSVVFLERYLFNRIYWLQRYICLCATLPKILPEKNTQIICKPSWELLSYGGEGIYLDVHQGENPGKVTIFVIKCQTCYISLVSKEHSFLLV